jgi:hypothetical protein
MHIQVRGTKITGLILNKIMLDDSPKKVMTAEKMLDDSGVQAA